MRNFYSLRSLRIILQFAQCFEVCAFFRSLRNFRSLCSLRKMECAINRHRDLAERNLDGLQTYALDIVRRAAEDGKGDGKGQVLFPSCEE